MLQEFVQDGKAKAVSADHPLPVAVGAAPGAAPLPTNTLGRPTVARRIVAGASSASVALTAGVTRVSIRAVAGAMRYAVAVGAVTATADNSGGVSHYIGADERLDISVPSGATIATIKAASDASATALEITELV